MAAGRTPEVLLALQNLNLFRFDAVDSFPAPLGALRPQRGLSADWRGVPVYILDVFLRRKLPQADIALVQSSQASRHSTPCYTLGQLRTVAFGELTHVRLDFQVLRVSGSSVVLHRKKQQTDRHALEAVEATAQVLEVADISTPLDGGPTRTQQVTPAAAVQHADLFNHKVGPWGRTRLHGPVWIWDVPYPFALHCRPWRCHSCKRLGSDAPDALQYFPVKPQDIVAARPGLLRQKCEKQKEHWFTPRFVLEASLIFYETLNAKQVRRQLASIWSSNALHLALRLESRGIAPWTLARQCANMPKSAAARPRMFSCSAALAPPYEIAT